MHAQAVYVMEIVIYAWTVVAIGFKKRIKKVTVRPMKCTAKQNKNLIFAHDVVNHLKIVPNVCRRAMKMRVAAGGRVHSTSVYHPIIKIFGALAVCVGLFCRVQKFHIVRNRVARTLNVTRVWLTPIADGVRKITPKVKVSAQRVHLKAQVNILPLRRVTSFMPIKRM